MLPASLLTDRPVPKNRYPSGLSQKSKGSVGTQQVKLELRRTGGNDEGRVNAVCELPLCPYETLGTTLAFHVWKGMVESVSASLTGYT